MPEIVDPYLDPAAGILRNEVGAFTRADLASAEGALTFARAVELVDTPVRATGDLDELRAIHRHLFQDVYDWAGQLRHRHAQAARGRRVLPPLPHDRPGRELRRR
ncbi:Fic family protein [Leucobacter sp. wl10]|uniref:Fic family protein n=1 Tax=Leucobacter sp. wl10 TaxID=2304677 RepID=UPI001F098172|nr:Fic family protein [Leucobacter sp. wl10]